MFRDPTPYLLRIGVVVGAAALVLGLAGGALVVLRGPPPAAEGFRMEGALPIRVVGLPADTQVLVHVTWTVGGTREEADALAAPQPGLWYLAQTPPALEVSIRVIAVGHGRARVLWEGTREIPEHGALVVDVAGG